MAEYKLANKDDLEMIWKMNVDTHPGESRWVRWKEEYIDYNQNGMAKTFVVIIDGIPVGEGTLIISSDCSAINGKTFLADGKDIGNVNALRIIKKYEAQGHISQIVRMIENYASEIGMKSLTIGVGRDNIRNVSIYKHWGYDRLIFSEFEDGEWVDYYGKDI